LEWKQEREEQTRQQIDEFIDMGTDEYHTLQIKLESEIESLEQQLQEVQPNESNL
jgi:hypothetical protein